MVLFHLINLGDSPIPIDFLLAITGHNLEKQLHHFGVIMTFAKKAMLGMPPTAISQVRLGVATTLKVKQSWIKLTSSFKKIVEQMLISSLEIGC